MLNATLTEMGSALAARRVSSVELTELFLARVRALNGTLNAFITVDERRALDDARRADAQRAAGQGGPLTGIPIAHKDIFCTRGMLTTCGSRMLASFVSPYDAHVVERLGAAGAVVLGKTNMDEFAMGSSNETSWFGPVRNPWDKRLVPGGSSGGSAAAVADSMAPLAFGTQTAGSVAHSIFGSRSCPRATSRASSLIHPRFASGWRACRCSTSPRPAASCSPPSPPTTA